MTEEFSPERWAAAWAPMRLSTAFGRNLADFALINATSLFNLSLCTESETDPNKMYPDSRPTSVGIVHRANGIVRAT